jgi:hypothetical protein
VYGFGFCRTRLSLAQAGIRRYLKASALDALG